MANYHANEKTIENLTPTDKAFLKAIYDMRCLDASFAFRFFYAKTHPQRFYCDRRLEFMVSAGLIEPLEYGKDYPALFLTTLGVETLRYLELISPDSDSEEDGDKTSRQFRYASSLRLKPQILPHQLSLNYFVLDFKGAIASYEEPIYFDGLSVPKCSDSLHPDGLIIYRDHHTFLEMDMASERRPQLKNRCTSYLRFLSSPSPYYFGKKISVLFILENVATGVRRRYSIINCMFESGIFLNYHRNIEFYVNTPEVLQPILQANYDPISSEFLQEASAVQRVLSDSFGFSSVGSIRGDGIPPYEAAIHRRGEVSEESRGIPSSFLLDFWYDGRLSMLNKLFYHQKYAQDLCRQGLCTEPTPYLVAVPNEKYVLSLLKACDFFHIPDVYFISASRLDGRPFPESVFSFSDEGNCIHFTDNTLKIPVIEREIR